MDFQSLQKLRFFLAIVFPVVGRSLITPEQAEEWLERHPRLKSQLAHLRDSKVGANLRHANETFGTGGFDAVRLDWRLIPGEAAAVLRAGVVAAAVVCVLVPIAMRVPWPELSREAITGEAGGAVAGWSVALWMAAAALAWGCLLAGTAAANRAAFLPAILVFLFFTGAMTASLPRSWWNLALPLGAAGAVVFCEARSAPLRAAGAWRGVVTCVAAGMMTGFILIAATPAGRWVPGRVLAAGLAAGAPLGVGLWWCGRRLAGRIAARGSTPRPLRLDAAVAVLAGLHLCLTASLAARGGILVPAQDLQAQAVQITGYLWPFYYFVGVGVVFKVLRRTKVLHTAARELVPARVFLPVGLALLAAATAAAWSESLTAWLSSRPAPVLAAAAGGLHAATAWIWSRPLWAQTLEWFRWVLLAIFALAVWNAARRRLDAGRMAALLFPTLLLGLGTYEYVFEFAGFARSPAHTAASLFAFSVFGLWLAHTALRPFLAGESEWWPRPARIALYCAGLMFVLLPVHVRAAVHDRTISSEIYLYLFFGIVDLGLPYYLFIYAGRRFRRLPLSAPALLGLFGAGAALSVPFTLLDQLAASGWSAAAVWAAAGARVEALLQGGPPAEAVPFLPPTWVVVRGLLAVGAVLAAGAVVGRRMRGREFAAAATVFAVVAAATGLACFANRSIELPLLPPRIVQLITPMDVSRQIDAALVARYLSLVIPAFLIGLVLTGRPGWFVRAAGVGAALLAHAVIATLWPAHEPWLRSSGVLSAAGASAGVVLLILLVAVRNRLDAILALREEVDAGSRLVSWNELRAAGLALVLGLTLIAAGRIPAGRLVPREVGRPAVAVSLPAFWHEETTAAGTPEWKQFVAPTGEPFPPRLAVEVRTCESDDVQPLLEAVGVEASQRLDGFAPTKRTALDRFRPGALALGFEFEARVANTAFPALGTIVAAPVRPGAAVVFTMVHTVGDRERQWDLARALQTLPR